ncbi:hypothetical protein AAG906_005692 [Vitis piasezkii]
MEPLIKVLKLVGQDKSSHYQSFMKQWIELNWLSRHRSSNRKSIGKSLIEGGKVNCIDVCICGYVSQVDPNMSWAQGGENYYATQDTDHGYRPGYGNNESIWKD